MRKIKNYLKKTPNGIEKVHPDFSEERKEERPAGHVGVFFAKIKVSQHSYTLQNYSNFKSNFHLTIGVLKYMIILELGEMSVIMIYLN